MLLPDNIRLLVARVRQKTGTHETYGDLLGEVTKMSDEAQRDLTRLLHVALDTFQQTKTAKQVDRRRKRLVTTGDKPPNTP